MPFQEFREALIRRVGLLSPHQFEHLAGQASGHDTHAMASHLARCEPISEIHSGLQQRLHATRECQCAAGRPFDQCVAAAEQMRKALLMFSLDEMIVDAPAVVAKDARPVQPQQTLCWAKTSRRVDLVTRPGESYEGVKPSGSSVDSPARLIADHLRRSTHVLANLFVRCFQPLTGTKHASAAGATSDRQIEQHLEQPAHFPVAEPQLLVGDRDRSMNVGAELRSCSARGVGRLQLVPSLDAAAASAADADVDVKLPVNDGPRDLGLELDGRFDLLDLRLAALWAGGRQRYVVRLVDRSGAARRWWLP